ncbi:MAG: hypothetical protein ABFD62_11405 [Syntrophaceae bacterium]
MKRKLLLICLAAVFAISCNATTKVWLNQQEIKPSVNEYAIYKNKDLMLTLYNNASRYYYSDALSEISYTSFPSVNTFLLDVYQDMFMRAGFIIYAGKPSARIVPELKINVSWISDETMVNDVLLTLDEGIRFKKQYTIKMPPSKQTDTTEQLQKKAYRMMEQSGRAILDDPAFQKAYSAIQPK